jgi:uncharacterized membrane protein
MRRESNGYLGMQIRRPQMGVFVAAVLCLFLVLALAADAWARSSGGRYGGRSGFSQSRRSFSGDGWSGSRPAPTRPYSAPPPAGYAPPMPSPGFGFFPFLLPFLGWGGGGGGGFGFGGIFGLFIILGIVAFVGRILLRNLAAAHRDRQELAPSASLGGDRLTSPGGERYAVVKCQLALLSTARSLQRELQTFANAATTDTVEGLAAALQDVVMALMRHSDYWRYGVVQVQHAATLDDAERTFNRVVSEERAKLSEEVTVNIDGRRRHASMSASPPSNEVGQNLVVTLIVATGYPEFTAYPTPSPKDIEDTLQRLGTLLTSDLLALEVIWAPENPDDALTEDELIAEYPDLSAL